jgi:type II secretory pathway component PulF
MKFSFQAKSPTGEVREGKIEAVDSKTAITLIQEKGLIPLSLEKEKEIPFVVKDIQRIWEGVNMRELAVFFRQLATLLDAKVSVIAALKAVEDQTNNSYLETIIKEMISDIEDGVSLSESMSKHPAVFKPLAVNMVKAGELSGNLQRSIMFLANNTEKNYELSSKIKSAVFYPAFVFSAAVVIGFVVFTVVLPKLTSIFKDMNVEIPWYTSALMSAGDFMNVYWWAVLLGLSLIALMAVYYLRTEEGRREWDEIKMEIPIIGNLFRYMYLARFAENLAVLLDGGIPIVRALIIVSEVVNSTAFESVILRAADEVKTGGAMSNVFTRSPQFPPIVAQMVKIGEDAGKISEVLRNVSDFYGKETERITRNLSTMLEPILIVCLGFVVAILVFAILMPIYNMAGSIS